MSPAELEQLLDEYVTTRTPARAAEIRAQLLSEFLRMGNEVGTLRLRLLDLMACRRALDAVKAELLDGNRQPGDPEPRGLLGLPVLADPSLPAGTVELRNGDGSLAARAVNVGQLEPPLVACLRRLETAAANREHTMGDPIRLLEVQAELRAAAAQARELLPPLPGATADTDSRGETAPCPDCKGTGRDAGYPDDRPACPTCEGHGWVDNPCTGEAGAACPTCNGTGGGPAPADTDSRGGATVQPAPPGPDPATCTKPGADCPLCPHFLKDCCSRSLAEHGAALVRDDLLRPSVVTVEPLGADAEPCPECDGTGRSKAARLEDAVFGKPKKKRTEERCTLCGGTGRKGTRPTGAPPNEPQHEPLPCPLCKGSGMGSGLFGVPCYCGQCEGTGHVPAEPCPRCFGLGWIDDPRPATVGATCPRCKGSGRVPAGERSSTAEPPEGREASAAHALPPVPPVQEKEATCPNCGTPVMRWSLCGLCGNCERCCRCED